MLKYTRIQPLDITELLNELYWLLKNGETLVDALALLKKDQDKSAMRDFSEVLHVKAQTGITLPALLADYPQYFESFALTLLQQASNQSQLLERLGEIVAYRQTRDWHERTVTLRLSKLFGYFMALLTMAMTLFILVGLFIIPVFANMYRDFGAELPMPTQMVVVISEYMIDYKWLAIFIALVLLVTFKFNSSWRAAAILYLPILGRLSQKLLLSRFLRSLAFCLAHQIPPKQAIAQAAEGVLNPWYTKKLRHIAQQIPDDKALWTSWQTHFPLKVAHRLNIAIKTKRLPETCTELADFYYQQVALEIEPAQRLLSAFITAIIGTLIGIIVIAVYLPVFKISAAI